jgi:hypothetical protein
MADLYATDVATEDLVPTLHPLLASWGKNRQCDEGLGDYYQRILDRTERRTAITGKEEPSSGLVQLKVDL